VEGGVGLALVAAVVPSAHAVAGHAGERGGLGRGIGVGETALVGLHRRERRVALVGEVHLDADHTPRVELRGRVDDHEAGQPIGVLPREEHGDASAEGVSAEHQPVDPEGLEGRLEVGDVMVVVVQRIRVAVRVAVAPQVEGERAVVGCDLGREVVPDVGLVAESVKEHEGHALLAPLEQVELETLATGDASRSGLHGFYPSPSDAG
jgi:hypothetical protein